MAFVRLHGIDSSWRSHSSFAVVVFVVSSCRERHSSSSLLSSLIPSGRIPYSPLAYTPSVVFVVVVVDVAVFILHVRLHHRVRASWKFCSSSVVVAVFVVFVIRFRLHLSAYPSFLALH